MPLTVPCLRYLLLLWCLSLCAVQVSLSQNALSTYYIQQQLLGINKQVVNHSSNSVNPPCRLAANTPTKELVRLALSYINRGEWQCSRTILQSIKKRNVTLTPIEECHFHLAWAEYYTLHQNYVAANVYATLANKQAEIGKWKKEKAHALLLLSTGGLKRRNISSAYLWADSALIIAQELGDESLEAKVLCQLALCARRHFTASGKRSFPYFLMARDKAIASGDSLTLGTIDLYVGTDYFELNRWAEGFPYFIEGINLSFYNNNYAQTYLANIALGYAFQLSKQYREGIPVFTIALNMSQRHQQPYDMQHCYHDIAKNYQQMHRYDSALVYADLAGKVNGVDSFWANVWETKAAIYNNMGEYKTAAGMYQKSVDWFREDFLYRNQDQISGYEAKLNTHQKELQVTEQKKRALQLEWIMGGIGGLLIISAWAFAVQRKARHKLFLQNIVIEKQRGELEQSLGEKEILLKEIHHRVKNNLSVISSLLELQSSGMHDESARAAIAVGQNRVSSIALIHQRLYQHENLAAIELGGFLQDLMRQVSSVFKKPGMQIRTDINMPETLLDIDTAVPLGLIMNELLTNSYKYAFDECKEGTIKIDLQRPKTGEFLLTYLDNGPGVGDHINIKNTTSLGLRLINRLSKQLGGSATYHYNDGSCFNVHFKDSNTRNHDE